tara:strand:+ start:1520 stop:2143 length:624 start_codon:yes stop_codon:yes gene_type:complete
MDILESEMNIFYFYDCPVKSAEAQPDKMLVKMPLETAQMLCTAHRELDGDEYADKVGLYKRAYWNHPCTVWARASKGNYEWLYAHFLALGMEYAYRYKREHASITKLGKALEKKPDNIYDYNITLGDMPLTHPIISKWNRTPIAQCMPDQYKNEDPIKAYRDYCIHEKHYAKWEKGRDKPKWWVKVKEELDEAQAIDDYYMSIAEVL